ncbi:MAG: hypothetical protein ACP5O0_02420 [Acidimicrobiales bacterium]
MTLESRVARRLASSLAGAMLHLDSERNAFGLGFGHRPWAQVRSSGPVLS